MSGVAVAAAPSNAQAPRAAFVLSRAVLALLLCAVCVALVVFAPQFRAIEAWSATPLTGLVTGGGARHIDNTAILLFGLGTPSAGGLRITPECSAVALVLPVIGVAAFLVAFGKRFSAGRTLAAALGTCTVILLVNTVRIALIAVATQWWGSEGYEVSHLFAGSAISLAGFSFGLIVGFRILVSGDEVTHRIPDPTR